METGGGRCPKSKGPNVPCMLQNIGMQPNPQKCQTANSNKCQITLFALGVCKICPGRTFFSPIPSPTAAPIYFVHFRKVQVLNLGRKSNQSAIWSKIFRTPDEHYFASLQKTLFVVWHQFFSKTFAQNWFFTTNVKICSCMFNQMRKEKPLNENMNSAGKSLRRVFLLHNLKIKSKI